MLEGIKILAERIEAGDAGSGNSSDYNKFSRWDSLIRQVMSPRTDGIDVFTEEEREHIRQAITKRARATFNADVLQRLSATPEEEEQAEQYQWTQAIVKQEGAMVDRSPRKMLISPSTLAMANKLVSGGTQ